ncbi:MAG: MATE family efflux transporter, partial [Clostridiales bacterium]|nr:MATE family efflux transporter [Clostridiales bacterium]
MITDLTQGKPSKKLFNLALPMVLSMVFQQLYNLIDSIIVGRFVGGNALYAVGSSYSLTMIFMAV